MSERKYYHEDSPWIKMPQLDWSPLTADRSTTHYDRGHIFYDQQEYCDNVFVIKRGRVAMCLCTPEGNLRITMVLDKGCIFGNQSILDGNPNSCQAEVVSDNAEIFVLSKQAVKEKLHQDPRLAYNMLLQSNRINRMLITQVELMSFRHSEGRVCFYLLHLADQYSEEKNGKKEMYLRYTHQDIAEITGLSRVCVSNIISGLVKDSILTKKDGMYSVVQMDKLQGRINISGIGDE